MSDFELFVKNTVFFYNQMTEEEKTITKNYYESFKESEKLEHDIFISAFKSNLDMTEELSGVISNKQNCINILEGHLNTLSVKYTGYGYTYRIGKTNSFTMKFYNYYKSTIGSISEISEDEIINLFNLYNYYQSALKTEKGVNDSFVKSKTDIDYVNDLGKASANVDRTYDNLNAYVAELKEKYNIKTL